MLIVQFLKYIEHEKRYSPNTCESYRVDLYQFSEYLLSAFEMAITDAKHLQVRSYIAHLMDSGLSENSINRKLSTLSSFYKYLLREEFINATPMSLVKGPKIPKRLPVFIDDHKMDKLLDSTEYFNESFSSVRDKLVLETLFGTGMRVSELVGLEDKDFDRYASSVCVLGKGNKQRIIPLPSALVKQLQEYIELKTAQCFSNNDKKLFVTDKGNNVTRNFIYRIVKSYLTYVSTQDKKSPHVLRHSYATSLLNRGADLNSIKELLGHTSLSATQVYTHNSIEKLKSIYKQAHPKA